MTAENQVKRPAGTRREKTAAKRASGAVKGAARSRVGKCPACGKPVGGRSKACPACGAVLDPVAIRQV